MNQTIDQGSTESRPTGARGRHWDTVPDEVLPLRESLPAISAVTRAILHSFAWAQPAVRGWLLQRQHEYSIANSQSPIADSEELHSNIDAVVALDLLRWQCNCLDREAIEKLSGCDEVAGTLTTDRHG